VGGINGWEGVILLLIVLLVVGPDKLPEFAAQFGAWVRKGRDFLREAKTSLKDEFGEDISDLRSLDPRQYDPRRIVREALMEDIIPPERPPARPPRPAAPRAAEKPTLPEGQPAPFDDEAT